MVDYKSYFKCNIKSVRGLPKVKLLGEKIDWVKLRQFVSGLGEYDLAWWIENVVEIISKIIKAYEGELDYNFWEYSVTYKEFGDIAEPRINGWILAFFPYIDNE
jgi:hypothetical protein